MYFVLIVGDDLQYHATMVQWLKDHPFQFKFPAFFTRYFIQQLVKDPSDFVLPPGQVKKALTGVFYNNDHHSTLNIFVALALSCKLVDYPTYLVVFIYMVVVSKLNVFTLPTILAWYYFSLKYIDPSKLT